MLSTLTLLNAVKHVLDITRAAAPDGMVIKSLFAQWCSSPRGRLPCCANGRSPPASRPTVSSGCHGRQPEEITCRVRADGNRRRGARQVRRRGNRGRRAPPNPPPWPQPPAARADHAPSHRRPRRYSHRQPSRGRSHRQRRHPLRSLEPSGNSTRWKAGCRSNSRKPGNFRRPPRRNQGTRNPRHQRRNRRPRRHSFRRRNRRPRRHGPRRRTRWPRRHGQRRRRVPRNPAPLASRLSPPPRSAPPASGPPWNGQRHGNRRGTGRRGEPAPVRQRRQRASGIGWQSTAAPSSPAAIATGHLFRAGLRDFVLRTSLPPSCTWPRNGSRCEKPETKLFRSLQITKRGTKSRGSRAKAEPVSAR